MIDHDPISGELLQFFKAMADATRLKILGLLAQESLSVEQIAEMLQLRPSTISHHLSKLADAGLVSARASSYYNIYQLENSSLESMAQRLLSGETLSSMAADIDLGTYDRKVVSNYSLPDGRLKTIPAQRKKLDAILNFVIRSFKVGEILTEHQVNQVLKKFHGDTATLRRELIGAGLLARSPDGSQYWRVENPPG